jgi:hypothetical protein
MVDDTNKPNTIGEIQEESVLDDQDGVDVNIDTLIAKFVDPINRFRSKSAPNVRSKFSDKKDNISTDNPRIDLESRAHAFYRMLGLPAIDKDGNFYNPGYTGKAKPKLSTDGINVEEQVNNNIPQPVKNAIHEREYLARVRYQKFYLGDVNSSIYSLSLAVPNVDALTEYDSQTVNIPERSQFIQSNYTKLDGSAINAVGYDEVSHILRPFMTNPIICSRLKPTSGDSSVMVAAPFLDQKDLELERNTYVKRPGIELILRLRLRQQNTFENTAQQSINTYNGEFSLNQKREIAAALTNTGVREVDIDRLLNGPSYLELYMLNDFIKGLKGIIKTYVECVETISNISKQIIWTPLSNEGGPESGTTITANVIKTVAVFDSFEIEQRIKALEIKQKFASSQVDLGKDLDYSKFTIPFSQELSNLFTTKIQEEKNKREKLENDASNALRTIEYISGEVSGLGLVDIFAIYMALWSVDISVLLNLLDDAAVDRLYKIKELQTQDVINRHETPAIVKNAYQELERRIMSILSYADTLYVKALASPLESESGDIPRNTTGHSYSG